jgi:hypothetical protein
MLAEAAIAQPEDVRDGEIVGLHSGTHGRSCERHEACGLEVEVGSIVRFKMDVIMVDRAGGIQVDEVAPGNQVPETVLKVVLVEDGRETCHVGFLPRHISLRAVQCRRLHGQYAQVIELYDQLDEEVSYKRTKSQRNYGMASFVLLNDAPFLA